MYIHIYININNNNKNKSAHTKLGYKHRSTCTHHPCFINLFIYSSEEYPGLYII